MEITTIIMLVLFCGCASFIQRVSGFGFGITGGLFAMPGPPAVLYFLASEKTKESYLAGIQTYFLIGNVMMTLFRAKAGFVTAAVGYAWIYGMIGVLIGAILGAKAFKKIPIKVLRKIVYAYMAVSGVITLVI